MYMTILYTFHHELHLDVLSFCRSPMVAQFWKKHQRHSDDTVPIVPQFPPPWLLWSASPRSWRCRRLSGSQSSAPCAKC